MESKALQQPTHYTVIVESKALQRQPYFYSFSKGLFKENVHVLRQTSYITNYSLLAEVKKMITSEEMQNLQMFSF